MSLFGEETITMTDDSFEEQSEEVAVETEYEAVEETEEQAESTEDTEDSQEEQSEELIGGQFKSTEDLLKSYRELQKTFTKDRQQTKQEQPQEQLNTDDYNDRIIDSFNRDPAGTINYLVQQQLNSALAPINQERQVESLTKNFDPIAKEYKQLHSDEGVNQLFSKISELAQDFGNPELVKNPTQRIMRMAAAELWGGETKAKIHQSALEQGRQEAENLRKQKQGLAVTTTKKPNEAPKTEADHIIDGMFAASGKRGLFG